MVIYKVFVHTETSNAIANSIDGIKRKAGTKGVADLTS